MHEMLQFYILFYFISIIAHLVQLEILHTDESGCPVELLKVNVPRGDYEFDADSKGDQNLPYERLMYDKLSGHSPNNPRRQVR